MESKFEQDVREFFAKEPFNLRSISKDALDLYCEALTHDSYSNDILNVEPSKHIASYERLEFLGDAILEFIVCEHVYRNTDLVEGPMTDYKQSKVANHMISEKLQQKGIDLDSVMRVGGGDLPTARKNIKENMRADCFEAIIAATYLSYGIEEARRLVTSVLL